MDRGVKICENKSESLDLCKDIVQPGVRLKRKRWIAVIIRGVGEIRIIKEVVEVGIERYQNSNDRRIRSSKAVLSAV